MNSEAYVRGMHDAYQDRCENAPFASVGGLEKRTSMIAPKYVAEGDVTRYLAGYSAVCEEMFGSDWRTCEFGWQAALTLVVKREVRVIPIHEGACHMSLGVFINCCEGRAFVDCNGIVYLATATEMSNILVCPSHVTRTPNFAKSISEKWTHVVWIDK